MIKINLILNSILIILSVYLFKLTFSEEEEYFCTQINDDKPEAFKGFLLKVCENYTDITGWIPYDQYVQFKKGIKKPTVRSKILGSNNKKKRNEEPTRVYEQMLRYLRTCCNNSFKCSQAYASFEYVCIFEVFDPQDVLIKQITNFG